MDAATDYLTVFNLSGTMERGGGRVQLDQSDMHLALNMAKIAKEGFSCAPMKETKQLITKPRAEVQDQKTGGVVSARHNKVKAEIERHPAMVYKN